MLRKKYRGHVLCQYRFMLDEELVQFFNDKDKTRTYLKFKACDKLGGGSSVNMRRNDLCALNGFMFPAQAERMLKRVQ